MLNPLLQNFLTDLVQTDRFCFCWDFRGEYFEPGCPAHMIGSYSEIPLKLTVYTSYIMYMFNSISLVIKYSKYVNAKLINLFNLFLFTKCKVINDIFHSSWGDTQILFSSNFNTNDIFWKQAGIKCDYPSRNIKKKHFINIYKYSILFIHFFSKFAPINQYLRY